MQLAQRELFSSKTREEFCTPLRLLWRQKHTCHTAIFIYSENADKHVRGSRGRTNPPVVAF